MKKIIYTLVLSVMVLAGCSTKDGGELNIYSARNYDVDKEVYEMFTKETGIKVNLVEGNSPEIYQRVLSEKGRATADVAIFNGAESIYNLLEEDLIEEIDSKVVSDNIDKKYYGDKWVGLSRRARILVVDADKVNPKDIKNYSDILESKFKDGVLVRSSDNSYNLSFVSALLDIESKEKVQSYLNKLVKNFARDPEGNDRDQVKALVSGEGKVAIVNSYYLIKLLFSTDQKEIDVAKKVTPIFIDGVHENLTFASIVKGAKNKDNALKFIEFLTRKDIQEKLAIENGEFATNLKAKPSKELEKYEGYKTMKINYETFGKNLNDALKMMDKAGWK